MEPVTASATNQQKPECWICLGELAGKFHDFVLTHCCKTIVHTRCLQGWKEQKQSLVGRNICKVKPNHAYLRCGVCGHNALPLVNLDTIVYSNSKSTSYCKSDLAKYLQQYIASNQANSSGDDQSGAGAVSNRTIATLAPTAGPPAGSANDATSSDGKIPDLPTLVRLGLKRSHDDMRAGIQELLQVQACVVGDQAMLEEIANQDPLTVCSKQRAVMYCGEAVPLVTVAAEHNQTSCVKTLANKSEYMFSWSFKDALDNDDPKTLAMLVQCDDKGLSGKYLVQAIEQCKSKDAQMLLAAGVDRNMAVMEVIDHYQSPETISSLIDLGFSCGQIIFMAAQANNRRLLRDLTQLPELRRVFGHAHCVEATILAAQQDNHTALRALTDIVPLEEALCASVGDQNEAAIAALLNEGACYADALSHAVSTSQRAVFDQLLIRNTGDCGYFLRLAAQNGDAALVDALLDADVGDIDSHTYADTPLAVAARNSHVEVVKLLYFALPPERRADVIAQAAIVGTETELQSLLATCEDAKQMFHLMRRVIDYVLDHPDYGQPVIRQLLGKIHTGKTAMILSEALDNKDYKTLATLLAAGADANTTTPAGLPLLHTAAERGDLQLVHLLLEQGANVNLLNREGKTPALIAVDKGHKSVANWLIKAAGAGDIETLLAEAVARGDVEVLSRLLPVAELGGSQFRQLFHQAAVNKQGPVVNYFAMQSTLSVEIAFLMAVYDNELGAVAEFLKAGIYKSRGCSPSYLLMAAVRREEEKVKTFIQEGVDASNDIKLAAQARETEALSVLLSGFADIEARNQQVEAIIFREVGDPSVLSSLVAVERDSGAAGLRAILFSILARSTKAHNVLQSALERIQTIDDENPGDNPKDSPAQYRQGSGHQVSDVETPIASSLIRQSCTDAIKHNQAQLKQNQAVIQALINAGVDLDITDDRGVSFLTQAIQGNCQDIVRSILDCWKSPGPLLDNSAEPQPDGRINTDRSMILTDALELAIGLDRQHMIMLLLDSVNGMKNVQFDRSRLDGNSNILYRIAHMGNPRLLRELWQLGFRATPSLQQIVHRADKNKLQQLVAAGVKLNATDVGSQMHPLLLAITLRATDLPLVRSMVAITDNPEDVICDQVLKTQKKVLSQLCQIVAEDHTRIMNMLVRAANGENHGLFQTLAGVQQMAGQLGRCLSDAAHRGHNKVVSELLNVGVDINDSNLGLFLYETALEHPDIAKMMVDHWQGKANRDCQVIIKEAVNLANPGSQQICAFLNSLSGMARSEEC